MGRIPRGVTLSPDDRRWLERIVRAHSAPQIHARRARILLGLAAGRSERRVAQDENVARRTVVLWRKRYECHGREAVVTNQPKRRRSEPQIPASSWTKNVCEEELANEP